MRHVWIDETIAIAIHEAQLAEHGGLTGLRDQGLLQSALARPPNLAVYGKPDIAALAAAYGYGLARNHPFIDGNKRTALVCTELFLDMNGYDLEVDDAACVVTILQLAGGHLSEKELAGWLRSHIRKKTKKKAGKKNKTGRGK